VVDGHIVTGFSVSNLTSSAGEGTISGHRVAYTRVSTLDQNTARQLDGTAVDTTFTDKASGKDVNRPQLAAMLGFVREGDTVIVHSMDRLARNLDDLRRIVGELTAKGVRVQFVKEQLTFTGEDTAMANLLASVVGGFAGFEGALIGGRQCEGITLAKQRGADRGRKKSLTEDQVTQLRQRAGAGEAKSALAREFGISRETVYQYLRAGS
jgi:DNA invertase Pin-like site-specific DNA recombinase